MIYLALLLLLVCVVVLLVMFAFFISFLIGLLTSFNKPTAPFIPIPQKSLSKIVEFIKVKEGEIVYDLGSGEGRVLFALHDKYKNGKFIGIEKDYFAHFWSKIKKFKHDGNIDFRRSDFFKEDLSSANIIFLYLFPAVLNALLPKFEKELKQGSVVYSVDFQFKDRQPNEVIDIPTKTLGRRLFVYKF